MTGRSIKVGLGIAAALTASMFVVPTSAYADYAPTSGDVVGVGSDTLQQLVNFAADGDYTGNVGYNSAGNKNKFISIDATADANSRLAYGTGALSGSCSPGTGTVAGTGNQNANHAETAACTLNPTVVLRAGLSPTQRPNGSGAGYNLLKADTNRTTGKGTGLVDFSRASSKRTPDGTLYDSITVGSDPLQMLTSTTTNAPAALTASQLNQIYSCSVTTWDQVGGTSTATIKPLLPQPGSGTRDYFLSQIGNPTLGNCTTNVEENDPEAIDASSSPVNAIEPMSVSRLNLFLGKLPDGSANGAGGYFQDPSCPFPPAKSSTPAACTGTAATLKPNVQLLPGGANGFAPVRNLYLYFRHADIDSTKKFQPGSTLNWVRTMFYNPCPTGATNCVTDPATGTQYGPGGAPFFASGVAQAAISAAGVTPLYAYNQGA